MRTITYALLALCLLFTGCAGLPTVDDARQLSLVPPKTVYVHDTFSRDKEVGSAMVQEIKTALAGSYRVVDQEEDADVTVHVFQQYFGDKRTEAAKGGGLEKGPAIIGGATSLVQIAGGAGTVIHLAGAAASINPVTGALIYLGGKAAELGANAAYQQGDEKHFYVKYLLTISDGSSKWHSFIAHDYAAPDLKEEDALAPLAQVSAIAVKTLMEGPAAEGSDMKAKRDGALERSL